MKGASIMYVDIVALDGANEVRLIKAAMELYPEYSKRFGLVFEFIPGRGVKLYVKLSEEQSVHQQEMKLVGHGVGILKRANIQGSVEPKRLHEGNAMFGL